MDRDQQSVIHSVSEGGVTGTHPDPDQFRFLVGPSTSNEYNLAQLPLYAVACWKVEDIRFAFDSSFVTFNAQAPSDPTSDPTAKSYSYNDIRDELKSLARVIKDYPGCPLSVFGHADPSYEGNFELGSATHIVGDDYNKALSGRRAASVYALLIANKELNISVSLWQQIATTENWGTNQRQVMRQATGLPEGTPMANLIRNYLQTLCPEELSVGKSDFLAQGTDSGGKGDYQGCSRFNPLVLFSAEDEQRFKTAYLQKDETVLQERNTKNAPNRRVMVLLFNKGSKADPSKWPCPRATEGIGGCVKRFWSPADPNGDGQTRRSTHLPDKAKHFEDTKDTFACRFYQRICSDDSPCHKVLRSFRIRLYDPMGKFIGNAPCRLTVGGNTRPTDKADDRGYLTVHDVVVPNRCTVQWAFPPKKDKSQTSVTEFPFSLELFLNIDEGSNEKEAAELLNNLGYVATLPLETNVRSFQQDYGKQFGLQEDGKLDEDNKTLNAIRTVHDGCADDLRSPARTI